MGTSVPLLVTSASGVNGEGYGALLAFDHNGAPLGVFCDDDRIVDPRGLVVDREEGLLYLNSGRDRILALDAGGTRTFRGTTHSSMISGVTIGEAVDWK